MSLNISQSAPANATVTKVLSIHEKGWRFVNFERDNIKKTFPGGDMQNKCKDNANSAAKEEEKAIYPVYLVFIQRLSQFTILMYPQPQAKVSGEREPFYLMKSN